MIVWPPSTLCGPRSSVPPVMTRTDVFPSLIFWLTSLCVSSSSSTMSFGFTDVFTPALCACAKASAEDKSMTADKTANFLMDPPKKAASYCTTRSGDDVKFEIRPGEPFPLGAHWDGKGTRFSVYSEIADHVDLCLFDDAGKEHHMRLPDRTAFCWHGYVPGAGPGQRY